MDESGPVFIRYDHLIRSVATEHHLDPMLVKAVVWRESRFDPKKHGNAGERGLMQVSEKQPTNGRARIRSTTSGSSSFSIRKQSRSRRLVFASGGRRWKAQSDPMPFALAEYNAGASRAQRWSGGDTVAAFRRGSSARISIFPERGSMLSQSSRATSFISAVGECERAARGPTPQRHASHSEAVYSILRSTRRQSGLTVWLK